MIGGRRIGICEGSEAGEERGLFGVGFAYRVVAGATTFLFEKGGEFCCVGVSGDMGDEEAVASNDGEFVDGKGKALGGGTCLSGLADEP